MSGGFSNIPYKFNASPTQVSVVVSVFTVAWQITIL